MRGKKIRVLVVDDSLIFREVISRGMSEDPNIEVVASAENPFEARDKILQYEPDVMTCDVEMPYMNGIEFIRRLLPQYPLPVVVVSSVTTAVLDAMSAGAVEFVTKPNVGSPGGVQKFIRELISKVKIAAAAKVLSHAPIATHDQGPKIAVESDKVVVIGASTGGTEAISRVLADLPSNMPGIVIVQHIPPVFSRMFAERLNSTTDLNVVEAQAGDYVEPGKVLIAPGDRHIRVKRVPGRVKVDVFSGEKVNGHCPSVDVLFESVAKEIGSRAIGIILTGMGYDGARGLLAMRRKGARTIGQDQTSSVVYGMPKAAFEVGAVERQASLQGIAPALLGFLR